MQHVVTHRYSITSNAAVVVNGPVLNTDGQDMVVQIHISPGNLFNVQTSDDGVLFANTIHEAVAAPAASTALGPGTYLIISRGKYARLQVAIDAGGPLVHVGAISVFRKD